MRLPVRLIIRRPYNPTTGADFIVLHRSSPVLEGISHPSFLTGFDRWHPKDACPTRVERNAYRHLESVKAGAAQSCKIRPWALSCFPKPSQLSASGSASTERADTGLGQNRLSRPFCPLRVEEVVRLAQRPGRPLPFCGSWWPSAKHHQHYGSRSWRHECVHSREIHPASG